MGWILEINLALGIGAKIALGEDREMSSLGSSVERLVHSKIAQIAFLLLALIQMSGVVRSQAIPDQFVHMAIDQSERTLGAIVDGKSTSVWERFDSALKSQMTLSQWSAFVKGETEKFGAITAASIHDVTLYHDRETLIAVDFSGKASKGAVVCGFLLWSGADKFDYQLRRIEMNYLPVDVVKSMEVAKAVQLMVDFRCPVPLIEAMTGVTVHLN